MLKRKSVLIGISLILIMTLSAFYWHKASSDEFIVPFGLPPVPWPEDNPYSQEKADLGKLLYFDKRLSTNGTISCATCHSIPRAFADPLPISEGIEGRRGTRHAPTVINAAYQEYQFWDGRAASLEEQAKGPIGNPHEMTLVDDVHEAHRQCHERIRSIPGYRKMFKDVFGNEECSIDDIAKAIATFERTVLSGNAPYDHYKAGDKTALTAEQIRGYELFHKTGCILCHFGPSFSSGIFNNIGIGMDEKNPDLGRYSINHDTKDWGAFKVPTLREVEHTYPYMHDGSLKTLEEVIDYYDKGGTPNKNLHHAVRKLNMTEKDKQDLKAFLEALSGEGWQHFKEPETFP